MPDATPVSTRLAAEFSDMKELLGRIDERTENLQGTMQRIEINQRAADEQFTKENIATHERITRHRKEMELRIAVSSEANERRFATELARVSGDVSRVSVKSDDRDKGISALEEELAKAKGGWGTILLVGGFATGTVGLMAALAPAIRKILL